MGWLEFEDGRKILTFYEGTDLTYVATSDVSEINRQLDVFDNRATLISSGVRGASRDRRMQSLVLVDADFSMLDATIQHRSDSKSQSVIIYFASQGQELRAHEFLQGTGAAQAGLASRIMVVSKPVGPRKLLAVLKMALGNLEEAPQSDDEEDGRSTLSRRKAVAQPSEEGPNSASDKAAADKPNPASTPQQGADTAEGKVAVEKGAKPPKTGKKSRAAILGDLTEGASSSASSGPVRPPINVLIVEGVYWLIVLLD